MTYLWLIHPNFDQFHDNPHYTLHYVLMTAFIIGPYTPLTTGVVRGGWDRDAGHVVEVCGGRGQTGHDLWEEVLRSITPEPQQWSNPNQQQQQQQQRMNQALHTLYIKSLLRSLAEDLLKTVPSMNRVCSPIHSLICGSWHLYHRSVFWC